MIEPINYSIVAIGNSSRQSVSAGGSRLKTSRPSSPPSPISPQENNKFATEATARTTTERPERDVEVFHDVAFQFSVHDETGKTIIKIIDKESNKVIREIPSEGDLERSAQLQAYVGQLFNKIA